jgi:ferric-dicitrate binding protein FerR (iron transport regulator)
MKDRDLDELQRAVRAADQPLDEVARLRIQSRIVGALERPARSRSRRLAIALALTLLPAAAGVLVLAHRPAPPLAPTARRNDDRGSTHLEVPAGSTLRTVLAGRAHIALRGPAEVEVLSSSPELVELRLPLGVLVGDYDHRAGGTLRIDSPGAITEVVGTVFAVEATPAGTRVSVSRGRVKVSDAGRRVVTVGGGQSWSSAGRTVEQIPPAAQRLFEPPQATPAASPAPPPAAPPGSPPRRVPPALHPPPRPRLAIAVPERRRQEPDAGVGRSSLPPEMPPVSLPGEDPPPSPAGAALPPTAPPPEVHAPAPRPPVAAPEESADALYARAEAAMKSGDLPAARAALERLVRGGSGPALASARYELARLAARSGDRAAAARLLDELLAAGAAGPLREPARFLRCRVDRGAAAAGCFRRFLEDYPGSAHAAEARRLATEEER